MSTNYINKITDTAGTTHDIAEGVDTRLFRATCSTTASTTAKVATLEDSTGFSLAAGVRVMVTFTYGNSATTPTLRVDGSSTGTAKTIATPTAAGTLTVGNGTTYNTWGPYETVIFTYNGTYWVKGGTGYAIYKAYANSGTDAKLQVGEVTSGTLYYPIVGTGTTAATRQYDTTGFSYKAVNGASSSEGSASLTLGNNLDLSTAGNKTGEAILMGVGGDYIKIRPQYTTGITAGITLYNNIGEDTYTYLLPPLEDTGGESGEALIVDNQHNQTIFGEKYFNTTMTCGCGSGGAAIKFSHRDDHVNDSAFLVSYQTINNLRVCGSFRFRQYSYNSSTGALLDTYESYQIPLITADLGANQTYDILTTKPSQFTAGRSNVYSSSNPYLDSVSTGSGIDMAVNKYGKFIVMTVTCHRAASTSANSNMLSVTLTSGYRPTTTVYATACYEKNYILGTITTSGSLTVKPLTTSLATDIRVSLTFAYLTA